MPAENNLDISSSLEDYLEAIAEILESNAHAHAKDIADALKVKMPSVTNALQNLSNRGLVKYRPHLPVRLTPAGAERAGVIIRRHQALRRFFADILALPLEESDQTACRVEHVIGETALARLVALSDALNSRVDCRGLREHLKSIMPNIRVGGDGEVIHLSELPPDKIGVVVKVAKNLQAVRKFADLGIVPGSLIQLDSDAPASEDFLHAKVMGSQVALRRAEAEQIIVKLTN